MSTIIPFPGMPNSKPVDDRRRKSLLDGLANLEALNRANLEHRQCMRRQIETMPCRPMKT